MENCNTATLNELRQYDLGGNALLCFESIGIDGFSTFWAPVFSDGDGGAAQLGIYLYTLRLDENQKYCGKRYTIIFQKAEGLPHSLHVENNVELYVLFEDDIAGVARLSTLLKPNYIKRYIHFVRAFTTIEQAKYRAFTMMKSAFAECDVQVIPYHVFEDYENVIC